MLPRKPLRTRPPNTLPVGSPWSLGKPAVNGWPDPVTVCCGCMTVAPVVGSVVLGLTVGAGKSSPHVWVKNALTRPSV